MRLTHSFVRFLFVGGVATAIHYAIFYALFMGFNVTAVIATSIGFAVSAVFNFVANYHFTFRSTARVWTAACRYAMVAGAGLVINAAIFAILAEGLGVRYLLSQVVATGFVLVWNYLGGRHFTFVGGRRV